MKRLIYSLALVVSVAAAVGQQIMLSSGAVKSTSPFSRRRAPSPRRARAADVATSMNVHKGNAQTNKAMAAGRRDRSWGATDAGVHSHPTCSNRATTSVLTPLTARS